MSDAEDRQAGSQADESSIGALLGRLVDDAESFVRAEVKLYRVEALHKLASYRMSIVMAAVGALLALGSVILLLIALVFALAPYTGTAWAALIISMLSLATAVTLFWAVWRGMLEEIDEEAEADT